jgi:hypothetical protein
VFIYIALKTFEKFAAEMYFSILRRQRHTQSCRAADDDDYYYYYYYYYYYFSILKANVHVENYSGST